jgi:hypothetical protein
VAGLLAWYATGGFAGGGSPGAHRSPSPTTTAPSVVPTTGGPTASPSIPIGACLLSTVYSGARCVSNAECYGELTTAGGIARAASLPCQSRHTWEVFALGQLPPTVTAVDYKTVKNTDQVRDLCSSTALAWMPSVGFGHAGEWLTDVLPPTPEAFKAGDHTFRCLAGKGPNKLTQPQFGKPTG